MTAPLPRGASPAGSRAPATEKRDIILRWLGGDALRARAADASHSSLLRVSTIGGIAIAVFALSWFVAALVSAAGQL